MASRNSRPRARRFGVYRSPASMWRAVGLIAPLVVGLATPPAAAAPYEIAVLQALDKITARVSTIDAPVGDLVRFGTLEIIARTCDKRPPEEPPESAAFVDIWEVRRGEPTAGIFRGWMFASSPALSALEHPVYDVWLLDCRNRQAPAPSGTPGGKEAPVIQETLPPPVRRGG